MKREGAYGHGDRYLRLPLSLTVDLKNIEGFDVEWMVYSYADKIGRSARFEISVLPLCAIVPCNTCWKCGLAEVRRQYKRKAIP